MVLSDLRRCIGGTVDDQNLTCNPRLGQSGPAPVDELPDSKRFVAGGDDNREFGVGAVLVWHEQLHWDARARGIHRRSGYDPPID